MATYIIGDVQGCYRQLQGLLEDINFNPTTDRLGFVGDLVNRGPDSLAVLRFIKKLNNPIIVLGNHDLYCLALGYGTIANAPDCLNALFNAADKFELLDWLRQQPLAIQHDDYFIVHAGIIPQWTTSAALTCAAEVSAELKGDNFLQLLTGNETIYGNTPLCWNVNLSAIERWRFIINALTRVRFCSAAGCLDLTNKTNTSTDSSMQPWFSYYQQSAKIVFGHWAALQGCCPHPNIFAIDTGCVYGGKLTAMRLDDAKLFSH